MSKANDPSFVRLAARLQRGGMADVQGSGWSISGLNVKEFPSDNPAAKRFVRKALNDGKLEPASKAEWEEVNDPEATPESLKATTKAAKKAAKKKGGKKAAEAADEGEGSDEDDSEESE